MHLLLLLQCCQIPLKVTRAKKTLQDFWCRLISVKSSKLNDFQRFLTLLKRSYFRKLKIMTIGGRVFEHRRRFHLLGASSRIPSARERRDTVWWRRRYVDVLDRREDRRLRRFGRLCRKSRKRIRLFDQRQGSAASMVMAYIGKQKGHLNLFVDFFASLN